MWQAWLVMLLSAALLLGARELAGWRLMTALCAWLAALWLIVGVSVAEFFTGEGLSEAAWFHAAALDAPLLWQFWPASLGGLLLLLFSGALLVGAWRLRRQAEAGSGNGRYLLLFALLLALLLQPAWQGAQRLASYQQDLHTAQQVKNASLAEWRVQAPTAPRSFIYIYVESLSSVFFDAQRYPALMPQLSALLPQAVKIDGIQQLDTTAWTIAGIAASQCGAPSRAVSAWLGERETQPLRCLGDQLAADGYRLSFIGGARLSFAGKGEFFRRHRFHEVLGLDELQRNRLEKLPRSAWGIYDDDLLRLAREKLLQLNAAEQPFGLVLLTLDTHAPRGHKTPACAGRVYGAGDKPLLNALHCTDYLVGGFVAQLLADPAYRDVTIILGSDHLLMKNADDLPVAAAGGDNTFYIFNPARELTDVARSATPFDIAPSVLHALGYEVGVLGLGRNLFASEPTLSERYGFEVFNRAMNSWLAPFAGRSSSSQSASW